METVDGWAWLVPVVCDHHPSHHGWHWWNYLILLVILGLLGYCVSLNTDRIGDLCGDSLAKLQGGSSRSSRSVCLSVCLSVSLSLSLSRSLSLSLSRSLSLSLSLRARACM